MGELHLDVYRERLNREYSVETEVGAPQVAYRETCDKKIEFNYLHKKQSGGSGQYGRVIGYIEPIDPNNINDNENNENSDLFIYENKLSGNNVPPEFHSAIKKGFEEARDKGPMIGHPLRNIRVVLLDGQAHIVDSNEVAFRTAAYQAMQQSIKQAKPYLLEPIMSVEIQIPAEFQATVVSAIIRRKGMIDDVEAISTNVL